MQYLIISGKARTGKDTTAILMKDWLDDVLPGHVTVTLRLSDPIKRLVEAEQTGTKEQLRASYQHLGIQMMKDKGAGWTAPFLHATMRSLPCIGQEPPDFVLVPDLRYKAELDWFKENTNAKAFRVEADDLYRKYRFHDDAHKSLQEWTRYQANADHRSETELDEIPWNEWDAVISNNGTKGFLKQRISDVLQNMKMGG